MAGKASISLRIKDANTGAYAVDHAWDLSDKTVLNSRETKFVEKGRIGIWLMGGFKLLMMDFEDWEKNTATSYGPGGTGGFDMLVLKRSCGRTPRLQEIRSQGSKGQKGVASDSGEGV